MSNFKKKVNLIIHNLLFNISLGVLTLFPLGVKGVTVIDDNNINNYTISGIDTSDIGDDVVIKTTSATAPHINHNYIQSRQGLYATDGKSITVDSTDKFIIKNNYAPTSGAWVGIRGDNYSHFTVNSELEITTNSFSSRAIDLSGGAHAVFNKKVTLSSTEHNFTGITIDGTDTQTSNTTAIFNDDVVIKSTEGYDGIKVWGSDIVLTFNGKATIDMGGKFSGIYLGNSRYDETNNSLIEFNNGIDLNVPNGTPIIMEQRNGKLNIFDGKNDIKIVTNPFYDEDNEPHWAIEAADGEVNINGKAEIIGNITAHIDWWSDDKGVVNLNLTDGSKLFGFMDNDSLKDSQQKGDINLNLSGSQSQWQMTGNSVVDALTLSDDAKVSFGYSVADSSDGDNYNISDSTPLLDGTNAMTLTADSLAGNGVFEMRTAIGTNLDSDLLKITGAQQATGNHQIIINDQKTGAAAVTGNEKIKLVETNGGDAKFSLFSSAIDIGGYEFNISDRLDNTNPDGKDWILSASSNSDNSNNSTDSNTDSNNDVTEGSNADNNNDVAAGSNVDNNHMEPPSMPLMD